MIMLLSSSIELSHRFLHRGGFSSGGDVSPTCDTAISQLLVNHRISNMKQHPPHPGHKMSAQHREANVK